MTGDSRDVAEGSRQDSPQIDFRVAAFPSDALSVRRFRSMFPDHFDAPDRITDGCASNDFFLPVGADRPKHLVKLTELICDERVVAAGAFYKCYADRDPEILSQEEQASVQQAKQRLVMNYQAFKLADSVETSALLVRQVEEEGESQARRMQKGVSR